MYAMFLTTPALSTWSREAWLTIGVLAAFVVGALCRLWTNDATVVALAGAGGVLAGAMWAESHFGQHDTATTSSWFFMIQTTIAGAMWRYNVSAVLMLVAGWCLANVIATKAAHHGAAAGR